MMNNQTFIIALGITTGALIPIQASCNAAFSKAIGSPVVTALMVFIVGLLSICIYILITKTPLPELSQIKNTPQYSYLGGFIIALYVILITFITPRLGVAASIGLIITGQLIGAIIIDHFGLFDTTVRSIDIKRLAGTLCMVVGIYLVMKK
jgi:bacterial/archaeal transporter family-2 protein